MTFGPCDGGCRCDHDDWGDIYDDYYKGVTAVPVKTKKVKKKNLLKQISNLEKALEVSRNLHAEAEQELKKFADQWGRYQKKAQRATHLAIGLINTIPIEGPES